MNGKTEALDGERTHAPVQRNVGVRVPMLGKPEQLQIRHHDAVGVEVARRHDGGQNY